MRHWASCQRVVAFEPGCPHQANQQHNDGCRQRNSRERNPRHAPKCLAAGDIRGNAEADEVGSLARRADRPLFNTSKDDGRREPGILAGPRRTLVGENASPLPLAGAIGALLAYGPRIARISRWIALPPGKEIKSPPCTQGGAPIPIFGSERSRGGHCFPTRHGWPIPDILP